MDMVITLILRAAQFPRLFRAHRGKPRTTLGKEPRVTCPTLAVLVNRPMNEPIELSRVVKNFQAA